MRDTFVPFDTGDENNTILLTGRGRYRARTRPFRRAA
jgi:hypothetical protein